jgi:putative ABC transport system permease protein
VIAYSVSQRTQEIGVRMALGATQGSVFGMVVSLGLRLALVGVGIGLCASFALTHLMSNLLFGVGANDLATFATAACVLTLVALTACYLPARRAVGINPTAALRGE